MLHLCQPFRDKIEVYWVDTGDSFPHIAEYIEKTCADWGFRLTVVKPPMSVHEFIHQFGYPVDLLTWLDDPRFSALDLSERPKLQHAAYCCNAMLWQPMYQALIAAGAKLVFRGAKEADSHHMIAEQFFDEGSGIEFYAPIWKWSHEDVMGYLWKNGVALPRQHQEGCMHSLDCMRCTGWGHTEEEVQRIRFTKKAYPEVYKEIRERTKIYMDRMDQVVGQLADFHTAILDDEE